MAGPSEQELRQWFQATDSDGDGHISAHELRGVMAKGGLALSIGTARQVIRIHDSKGEGTIGFYDFVRMHEFLTHVQNSFEHFDVDKSTTLSYSEVVGALRHAGLKLELSTVRKMFDRFDQEDSGSLDLAQFLEMTIFIRSMTGVFALHDPQQTGRATMTLDEFIGAVAECG